jgi:hypothetical protein
MPRRTWSTRCAFALLLLVAPAAVAGDGLHSKSVEIFVGSITVDAESHPQLLLILTSKVERALWIDARFEPPPPNQGCDEVKPLEPKGRASFMCPQDTIVTDVDYPIVLTVFGDSASTDTVERNVTHLRFGKKDAQVFNDLVQGLRGARQLPKSYADVLLKDKLGVTTALFSAMSTGHTLEVRPDGLEYQGKHPVTVSAAQVRRVSERRLGVAGRDAWIVLDYDDGGTMRMLAFQTPHERDMPLIMASLQTLLGPGTK